MSARLADPEHCRTASWRRWELTRYPFFVKRVVADQRSAITAERGTYGANRAMALLKAMFRKAHDEWRLMHGALPTDGIKPFPEEARERFLSPGEQVRKLKAILDETTGDRR